MQNPTDPIAAVAAVPVATLRTPFVDKFGVPRQAGLAEHALGTIEFLPPFDDAAMLDGLEGFTHIWLLSCFHETADQGWRAKVRPPRLGGNSYLGLWATRSPFRPNPIGLSAVRLLSIETAPRVRLHVAGVDLVDGTPLLDIKPYVPYADAIDDALGGFAAERPTIALQVRFSETAERAAAALLLDPDTRALISEVVGLDPRPGYQGGSAASRTYGARISGLDVRWQVDGPIAQIVDLVSLADS